MQKNGGFWTLQSDCNFIFNNRVLTIYKTLCVIFLGTQTTVKNELFIQFLDNMTNYLVQHYWFVTTSLLSDSDCSPNMEFS